MQHKFLDLLFGVCVLVLLVSEQNGSTVKKKISNSGGGFSIKIGIPNDSPNQTTIDGQKAICIRITDEEKLNLEQYSPVGITIEHNMNEDYTDVEEREKDLKHTWELNRTKFYICTKLEAITLFHRVEEVYDNTGFIQVAFVEYVDDGRIQVEKKKIISNNQQNGKSTVKISIVTYRPFSKWEEVTAYGGSVKIIDL
ncbi:uncharacterized protein LOC111058566 [Nilaparvata lugens]|uniref:uncharacterized protein LOC111058566 n=1 Tax=Nilaparvata lugens TaxID=108931 RepID=UPI00193E5931|nr:uncharacterized protein LOC111058566 [Nilaparvata lugens]